MQTFICKTDQDLQKVATVLLDKAVKNDINGASVIALEGNLGAGKTTLTKVLAKELGVNETVKSPTFLIMESYQISFDHFHRFIHIDAYRLSGEQELANLGFMDMLKDRNNLIVIEWPEKISTLVPKNIIRVNLSFVDEGTREISL